MQQPDPRRIRKITTTTIFINGVQQGPPTVTTNDPTIFTSTQGPPKVITSDPTIFFTTSRQGPPTVISNIQGPPTGPPTGQHRRPPPTPPASASRGGPGMNPVPAALIRIALGLAGVAFYSAIFLIVVAFIAFYYGAQIFTENLVYQGARSKFYSQRLDKWQNHVMWMWIDGFISTIKFVFTGGNTDLLREFFRSGVGKPLIRISKQYWDQEFRRL